MDKTEKKEKNLKNQNSEKNEKNQMREKKEKIVSHTHEKAKIKNDDFDHIEKLLKKDEKSFASDDMIENIKSMTKKKARHAIELKKIRAEIGLLRSGIDDLYGDIHQMNSTMKKQRRMNARRVFLSFAALCVVLGLVMFPHYQKFLTGTLYSSNGVNNETDIDSSKYVNHFDESKYVSNVGETKEEYYLKGINWAIEGRPNALTIPLDGVRYFLEGQKKWDSAWVSVTLKNLTPVGTFPTYITIYNSDMKEIEKKRDADEYISIAEIEVNEVYNSGNMSKKINVGDTLEIVVLSIVEGDNVKISYLGKHYEENKMSYYFPMTEIGKEYVIEICDVKNERMKTILNENVPEYDDYLGSNFSYPMFPADFSKIKNLNDFSYLRACQEIYVAVYERYIKNRVIVQSNETALYNLFTKR